MNSTIGQADGVAVEYFSLSLSLLFISISIEYNNDAFSHDFQIMMMMDQSTTINKLLRAFQFRKRIKEFTSACKRINKDTCYEFVTYPHANSKKSSKFQIFRSKMFNSKQRTNDQLSEHLAQATPSSPANLSLIVKQSYNPLHGKSRQLNKKTIAVTKDTMVKGLYAVSSWVFIEIIQTGQTGFVPNDCLSLPDSIVETNLSLLNVSIHEKHCSMMNTSISLPPGRFISSIGPCHFNIEPTSFTFPRVNKDQSNLSRRISNISLHAYDHDAYGTLNLTPCKNLSFSVLDNEPMTTYPMNRLRVMENYQRQFVGDISVLESEVVTLMQSESDRRFIRRGDGRQGYIPEQIVVLD